MEVILISNGSYIDSNGSYIDSNGSLLISNGIYIDFQWKLY